MIVLTGADVVLPDRVLPRGTVVLEGARITALEPRIIDPLPGATCVDLSGHLVMPGFIDVHVHGVDGYDVLGGDSAVSQVAARLPRYGVTAFCPTSIACRPTPLARMLDEVARISSDRAPFGARVLPAHLESNFINPEYNGAQPLECLRRPPRFAAPASEREREFSGRDILDVLAAHRSSIGIVTLAPEIEGGLELTRDLVSAGHIVSIGHSGASYDVARAAFDAGVRHATHLFNRMSPMSSRAPGVAGAVLESEQVVAELICDGFHVHPTLMRVAIRSKGVGRIMAITDATAGAGLPAGTRTMLGGRPIVVTERSVDRCVTTLRAKIGAQYIETVRDVGYRFESDLR